MMLIESAMALRVRAAASARFNSTAAITNSCATWSSEDVAGVHITLRRLPHSRIFEGPGNRLLASTDGSLNKRKSYVRNRIRASRENSGSASEPINWNEKPTYHPFEEISESPLRESGDARLTAAETTRTIIEVNSSATLMFSDLISDEIHENIFWPELPYVTDEHGNVYFQVKSDEDILQTLTSENNFVQVIIGLDTMEMISELDLSGPTEIDFGFEEIEDEDSDINDHDDEDEDEAVSDQEDWVAILDDEEDQVDSDETLGDWAKLDTMRYSHPMYFAKKLAEVASDDPTHWMDQPPAGLAIQGLLRPAFIEEHTVLHKHISGHQSSMASINKSEKILGSKVEDLGTISGHSNESNLSRDNSSWAEELEKDDILTNGASFYKLEMIKIQLISAHGHQSVVELEDFRKAQPDAIAHLAANIMSRLNAGAEKTTQALRSLCWRCKGIQVEEATLIGVDTLGFDVRVCSGTQVQTLRFAFNTRATSEYSAERQLNDILFPRTQHKLQKKKQPHQKEC